MVTPPSADLLGSHGSLAEGPWNPSGFCKYSSLGFAAHQLIGSTIVGLRVELKSCILGVRGFFVIWERSFQLPARRPRMISFRLGFWLQRLKAWALSPNPKPEMLTCALRGSSCVCAGALH